MAWFSELINNLSRPRTFNGHDLFDFFSIHFRFCSLIIICYRATFTLFKFFLFEKRLPPWFGNSFIWRAQQFRLLAPPNTYIFFLHFHIVFRVGSIYDIDANGRILLPLWCIFCEVYIYLCSGPYILTVCVRDQRLQLQSESSGPRLHGQGTICTSCPSLCFFLR